jgi:hypothetical protein
MEGARMPKNNVASTRLVASHALPAAEMTAPVLTRNKTHGPVDHSPRFVTCIPLVQRFVLCLLIGFLISVPAVNTFGQSEGPQRPNPYRPSFTPINNGSSATTGPTSDTTNPNAAAAPQNNSAPATAGNPAGAKSANPTPTPPSAQPGSAGPPTPSSTPLASRSTELSDGTANSAPATGQWQQQRGTMPPGTTTTISTEITKVSKTFGALPN